jgi:hypothetical protein
MKDKVKSARAQDVEEVFDATYVPKNPEDAKKEIIFAQGDTLTASSVSARNLTHHVTTNRIFKIVETTRVVQICETMLPSSLNKIGEVD